MKIVIFQEDEEEDVIDDGQLEVDRQIQANREKMFEAMSKKKKPSSGGVRSPKASKAGGKAGKKATTWDKTVFGGSVKSGTYYTYFQIDRLLSHLGKNSPKPLNIR